MASNTKQTEMRRKRKRSNMGNKTRKRQMRNKGSTPKFSIQPE